MPRASSDRILGGNKARETLNGDIRDYLMCARNLAERQKSELVVYLCTLALAAQEERDDAKTK
jgi:hypothetical protein